MMFHLNHDNLSTDCPRVLGRKDKTRVIPVTVGDVGSWLSSVINHHSQVVQSRETEGRVTVC